MSQNRREKHDSTSIFQNPSHPSVTTRDEIRDRIVTVVVTLLDLTAAKQSLPFYQSKNTCSLTVYVMYLYLFNSLFECFTSYKTRLKHFFRFSPQTLFENLSSIVVCRLLSQRIFLHSNNDYIAFITNLRIIITIDDYLIVGFMNNTHRF